MALSSSHLPWKDNMQLTSALKHHTETNLFQGKHLIQMISVWFKEKARSLKIFFSHTHTHTHTHTHKDTNQTAMNSDRHRGKIKDEEGRKR